MTAQEYRDEAERLMRQAAGLGVSEHERQRFLQHATVWAELAKSAAVSEQQREV